MKVDLGADDTESLERLGHAALLLLTDRDFSALAHQFGYALVFGRDTQEALRLDFDSDSASTSHGDWPSEPSVIVKYFGPSDSDLFAVIEWCAPAPDLGADFIQLIVTGRAAQKHITIEGLAHAA